MDIQTGHFDQSLDRYGSREQLERKREQISLRTLLQKRVEGRFNWADQALLNLLGAWGRNIESPADAEGIEVSQQPAPPRQGSRTCDTCDTSSQAYVQAEKPQLITDWDPDDFEGE